jgi:hypothetical protein
LMAKVSPSRIWATASACEVPRRVFSSAIICLSVT